MHDNRVFNVNGFGDDQLLSTLELVFNQESDRCTCCGWIDTKLGIILAKYPSKDVIPFPSKKGLTAKECLPMVLAWLRNDDHKEVEMEGWDANHYHDGSNKLGWRVFVEDWGHVGNYHEAICCIKPAYLWLGK